MLCTLCTPVYPLSVYGEIDKHDTNEKITT